MGEVYFYHLTRQSVDEVLPLLLRRSLDAGWRVAVRGPNPAQLDFLDRHLWQGPDEEFLPHGRAGGAHDKRQPILLTQSADQETNNPTAIMSISGADVQPDEVKSMQRVSILFDGHDAAATQAARVQWKALTEAGCGAQYWSQDSGRWEMKMTRPAADAG